MSPHFLATDSRLWRVALDLVGRIEIACGGGVRVAFVHGFKVEAIVFCTWEREKGWSSVLPVKRESKVGGYLQLRGIV